MRRNARDGAKKGHRERERGRHRERERESERVCVRERDYTIAICDLTWMLKCVLISSGVLPLTISATVLHARSSKGLQSRLLDAKIM